MDATANTPLPAETATGADSASLYCRLGELVRSLHEALSELGYASHIEAAVSSLPDAKSGLSYISRLAGEAAEKVLNAVDQAKADQDALAVAARGIAASASVRGGAHAVDGFTAQVLETCARTDQHLTTIMMAQDFHDLTGQVTRRLIDTVQALERDLVVLLVESAPPAARPTADTGELQGPVTDGEQRTDVVQNQQQVDDLLDSLGF